MLRLLWLIPALPCAGFIALVLRGQRLSRKGIAVIGVGSVGLSALIAIVVGIGFLAFPPAGTSYSQALWQWMVVSDFTPQVALYLDALSLVMVLVITGVGFLIHLYSSEFMIDDEGYSRFFAYMNLFVASMLTLVLADNLLLLYLGWEGVGLCSYLLIGFWYTDPANGRAARKAFIVTRVGDTAMAIGLFLLFTHLGTLEIQALMDRAAQAWPVGSGLAVAAAALLLGGAVGKSAQLPLQTWLPDAMAGPTPVSALIHAATMVTAGVYLIARTHVLFILAPPVQFAVAIIGALTLLLAAFSALTQHDIKRILAYSTISQIGYMFLALGVGAWTAAMFHFMTHAFFKALLFLGAGSVILSLHHEHDIFRMGGLRTHLPVTFWTFLVGGASLAGFPLVTAGFYSKDWILWEVYSAQSGGAWLWMIGLIGALLTAVYTFRLIFVVFFGEAKTHATPERGRGIRIPLIVLAFFSVVAGFLEMPQTLGHLPLFSEFMQSALPEVSIAHGGFSTELLLQLLAMAASVFGIYVAYTIFVQNPRLMDAVVRVPLVRLLHQFWFSGWGFDWLYDRLLVQPFVWMAHINRDDVIDDIYRGAAGLSRLSHRLLSRTQTGVLRRYVAVIAAGSVVIVAMVLLS